MRPFPEVGEGGPMPGVRSSDAAARGVTLVELAAVMAVIAVLLSIGVGVYLRAQQGMREDATLALLENAVREARQMALMNRAEAWLEIDPAEHRVRPVGLRTVAFFHLESADAPGAFGYPVELEGADARYSGRGHTGGGVEFIPGGSAASACEAAILLGGQGAYRLEDGGEVSLRCYLENGDPQRRQVLLHKGEAGKEVLLLELDPARSGAPRAVLEAAHETWEVTAEGFRFPVRRWVKVALRWREDMIEILIDDVVRARQRTAGFRLRPSPGEPLRVGHERYALIGRVDEIAARRLFRGRFVDLPEGYRLIADARRILFRPDGSLDRTAHTQPVRLGLTRKIAGEEKPPRTFTVGLSGRIER